MAVPKKKKSRSRSKMRRAHLKCFAPSVTPCSHCKALIASHRACPMCGYYKGREVISVAK